MQRSQEIPIHMQRTGFDPVPELSSLRQHDGIIRITSGFGLDTWLITRYADVRSVLSDWGSFSNTMQAGIQESEAPEPGDDTSAVLGTLNLLASDPPEHTRLRRTIAPEFTARRLRRLEPRITGIVNDHLDVLERSGEPGDLVPAFTSPIPVLVICELLGVPHEDREDFQKRTDGFLDITTSNAERAALQAESHAYMAKLVARNRVEPGDGLLGRLVSRHGTELDNAELVGLASLLLLAGAETTSNMLALGMFALLRHPEQLDVLRRDPELVDAAIEELLRWLSIVHNTTAKVATRQVQIAGRTINAGDLVMCSLPAANRDPDFVVRPDELDITRPASRHVAFGHGPHHCIGAPLARLQMRIALPALLGRFPGLRLAAEPEFRSGYLTHGLDSLPVMW
ncbi:cytochrome P450 [Saccharopolyspora spinosa]|uniref:Cytochrome P450 n=1 Tax=Saccharopolyspora spinosa TaxID=60894 RepID=A0A2N3Y4N9_SACSN|nr:cytochrome P450 [Saccharopolyspora spinosa]PKW17889.1 cytochrome P450 [Saccharopolyspora spinosa]